MLPERLVWAHPFKCSYLFMIPCCCCCLNVGVGGRDLQQRHAMHLCLFAAISSLFLFGPAAAQFGGFGGPAAKEGAPAVKSDIPYIRCSACEALAKNAYRQIKTVKDAQKGFSIEPSVVECERYTISSEGAMITTYTRNDNFGGEKKPRR